MISDLDYFELNIGHIYAANLECIRNGQITTPILEKYLELLQSEIIQSGELFITQNDLVNGDKNAKEYYIRNRKKYLEADTTNEQILLGYFFTKKGGYEFYQNIPISHSNPEIAFWFAFKLFTYEEDLTKVEFFLNYQYQLRNNDSNFLRFVKSISRQYQTTLYSVALVSTINDWVLFNEKRDDVGTKNQKAANLNKVYYNSFLLKPLYTISDHQERVSKVFRELKRYNFITKDSSINTFFHFLSNESITENKRIKWNASNVALKWFILNLLPYVEVVGKDHWHIAIKCFVKNDSTEYTIKMLRKANSSKLDQQELLKNILFTFSK